MATGLKHDQAIKFWFLPFSILISLIFDIKSGIISGLCFLIGGLWLSPDLDVPSKPLNRWGVLKIIWWPYRSLIKHRSIFSHAPIIGTTIRISYLVIIYFLISILLEKIGFQDDLLISKGNILEIVKNYPDESLAGIIGIEASALVHLLKDHNSL